MVLIVGLFVGLAVFYFWLRGQWFARVLVLLISAPVFFLTIAAVMDPRSNPPVAWGWDTIALFVAVACIGAWYFSAAPTYFHRRSARVR